MQDFPPHFNWLMNVEQLAASSTDEKTFSMLLSGELADAIGAGLVAVALPPQVDGKAIELDAVSDPEGLLAQMGEVTLKNRISKILSGIGEDYKIDSFLLSRGQVHTLAQKLNHPGGLTGLVFAARHEHPFGASEIALLQIAVRRAENALRYFHLDRQRQLDTLALQTILKIDRIRDSSQTLNDLIDRSLAEVCMVIPAQAGFLMILDRSGKRLEQRAAAGEKVLQDSESKKIVQQAADEAIQNATTVHKTSLHGAVRSLLCVPLILNNRLIGVLGVMNRHGERYFTATDQQLLEAIASQMDTAIFERLQTLRLRSVFERNVGPKVMERLLQIDDRDLLKGERVEVSTLFCDLRDFTAVSERLIAAELERILNDYLGEMVRAVIQQEGMLDKFTGDGLMALFNVPVRQQAHAMRAVEAALNMQEAQKNLMQTWQRDRLPAVPMGIGIATGEVIAGNFGSNQHAEYTVIGRTVNLAARLCAAAGSGEIWIDQLTFDSLGENAYELQPLPEQQLKGFSGGQPAWLVLGRKE